MKILSEMEKSFQGTIYFWTKMNSAADFFYMVLNQEKVKEMKQNEFCVFVNMA